MTNYNKTYQNEIKQRHEYGILKIVREKNSTYTEILEGLKKVGKDYEISTTSLTNRLKGLYDAGKIDFAFTPHGKKVYRITSKGSEYLDKTLWPLADYIDTIDRTKWAYFIFEVVSDYFYILKSEKPFDMFTEKAMYLSKIKQTPKLRTRLNALLIMLASALNLSELSKNQELKNRITQHYENTIKTSIKKHQDLIFADLNTTILGYVIKDIYNNQDLFKDDRINRLNVISKSLSVKNFADYTIIQYLAAAQLKELSPDFDQKLQEYTRRTQGLLIKMLKYQIVKEREDENY